MKKKFAGIASCLLAAVFAFSLTGCKPKEQNNDDHGGGLVSATKITDGYEKGYSRAPQTSRYLGTVDPVIPVEGVHDEHESYGVTKYPSYGKNLGRLPIDEFRGMISECRSLIPYPTWHSNKIYDAIDSEGYLLRNGERVRYSTSSDNGNDGADSDDGAISGGESGDPVPVDPGSTAPTSQYSGEYRKLYKHSTAETLYGGGLSDDEPRIVKEITCLTRKGIGSKQITGLYAPAGELIKIEVSPEVLSAAGGSFHIYIGQNYNIDGQDGISLEWRESGGYATAKGNAINRMSNILSHFVINSTTSYVGSFWGGPIYFRPADNTTEKNLTVKISGGVRYQHFILGATTREEYEANMRSTAPYFDLEVYDSAIRFTTGIFGAGALRNMTYEDCTDAAVLWDKITQVSKRVQANGLSSSAAPVNFIGDVYIAAGAAYANPGRNGVVCPPGWVASSLDYDAFVNGGSWGSMHEYNHCWQGYGFGVGGEVTNNATTLVSYSLYTRISQGRIEDPNGGLGGWNRFTDPAKALSELLTIREGNNGTQQCFDLSVYATLLHNIGQDNFLEAAFGGRENSTTIYYNNLVEATHLDMTWFAEKVLNYDIVDTTAHSNGVLQKSAVDAVKAKNYPVFVPVSSVYQVGRSITCDGNKEYIATAQPFNYGSGEFTMDFNNQNNFKAGSFVSKGLVVPDGFTVSVKSVTQPENGRVEKLENNKVKYIPADGEDGLYSGNFTVTLAIKKDDGAFKVDDVDLVINLKQKNDIQRTTYVYNEGKTVDPSAVLNAEKTGFDFGEYESAVTRKNVCTQETNTQMWAAGRNYLDDNFNANSTNYEVMPNNRTLQVLDGVLHVPSAGKYRFTLRGRGKGALYLSYDNGATWESAVAFEKSSGTDYEQTNYCEHDFATDDNAVLFKAVLLVKAENNFMGVGISAADKNGVFPAFTHATAYKDNTILKDSTKKFETEYRYKNEYKYTFTTDETYSTTENKLVSISHEPWNDTLKAENLFDGKANTYYHSVGGKANFITEAKPLELVADLGKTVKVNRVTFNGYKNAIGNNGMPVTFKLYGSLDGTNYNLLTEQTDMTADKKVITLGFDETEIRYYKLIVTKTDNNAYFAMNSIVFGYEGVTFENGAWLSPNEECVKYKGNWSYENTLCNFGTLYKAGKGDSVEFKFNGTRFAYLAYQSADYGTVDIYLDGNKIASDVSLSAASGKSDVAYVLFDAAAKGEHTVKIVSTKGSFNVDSFVYGKNQPHKNPRFGVFLKLKCKRRVT